MQTGTAPINSLNTLQPAGEATQSQSNSLQLQGTNSLQPALSKDQLQQILTSPDIGLSADQSPLPQTSYTWLVWLMIVLLLLAVGAFVLSKLSSHPTKTRKKL